MHPEFWLTRWERGEIGFHRDDVNPYLTRHWQHLALPAGARVLVPLCGKSRDLWWLRAQGHAVTGIELSTLAVEDFFREAGLNPEIRQHGAFRHYAADGVEVLCGDFFELRPEDLPGIAAAYDRAALIALPEDLRQRYARHLHALLPQGAACLLVTLDYPQPEMPGPPFAVTEAEVDTLYAGLAQVQRLDVHDVLGENARFRERGITRLHEHVYRLEFTR